MAGFGVAAVGALSTPYVIKALVGITGPRFFFLPLIIAFYGTFMWANKVSRSRPQNRYAYAAFTFVAGILAGMAMLATATTQASGPGIVLAALAMTAADFLILSAYALISKKDFSFLGSFIMMGMGVAIIGLLVGFFLHVPMLQMLISAMIVIACSAKILYDTSAMLRTGDYGDAAGFALSLFISLLNIFLNLLRLLSGGRRN
jgi:modulator of FtsH protease